MAAKIIEATRNRNSQIQVKDFNWQLLSPKVDFDDLEPNLFFLQVRNTAIHAYLIKSIKHPSGKKSDESTPFARSTRTWSL